MAFKDIPGNARIKKILRLALERNRLPNSLLFCGPEGVGKKAMALTLAKALNCQNMTTDSCDECASCRAIDKGVHPDVIVLAAEAKDLKIEQVRFLREAAVLRPLAGRKRVFVLEDAETMNQPSANALLKVLEEPPAHAHIILVTASPFLLLPTIRSRCQTLAFSPIGRDEIEEILAEEGFAREQARILALLVDGNLERALETSWDEVQALKEEAWALFEGLATGERASLFLERFASVTRTNQEDLRRVLEVFSSFARDVLLLRLGGDRTLLLNPDYEERLRRLVEAWAPRPLVGLLEEIDFVLAQMEGNLNRNLLALSFFSRFRELRHV